MDRRIISIASIKLEIINVSCPFVLPFYLSHVNQLANSLYWQACSYTALRNNQVYLPPHVCTLCVLIQRQSVLTRDWCKGGLVIKEVHTQEKIHKIWKNYRPKHLKLLRYSICWRFRFYTKYQSLCLLFGSSWLPPMAGKPTLYRPHRCKVAAVPDQQKWIKSCPFQLYL